MDQRRAAGALLALAVCIGSAAAAPTASNQTGLDLYDSSTEGCYYNFQHYGEGDRIMTNEPCLNCTCHNRMLMCYLRVCPFTKPIGQDCTVEKRADQCCPIVTCPDVPVDLLTSTTNSPAEYGATGLGKLDKYGCSIHGKYFPEGSKVPPTPNKPCEHCYCIRNMTTCVMQECTLHVDGCTPIYHKDVCCPVRYSCDHPEDETLLLDDMTTTVRPTPGFLLTTTTLSPVTQMSQDCVHDDRIFSDGALIKTEKACEHCYCMKGDIVCVVQECGTPMENEGKNCTSQAPREGQCCPDTYICEGDEVTTEPPSEFTTEPQIKDRTTPPPRRVGVEGSGYRNEDEPAYTEIPSFETDSEGSGYEQATEPAIAIITPEKETPEISTEPIDESLHIGTTTLRTPTLEEIEKTTEPDKSLNTVPSDEEGYELSANEKTTPSIEAIVTEPTITSHEQEQIEDKLTEAEKPSTPAVISMLDEISSTTDSPFRKEDDVGEPTETFAPTRDEATTKVAYYEDKPTTVQDYATHAETKAPFIEEIEKQTTLSAQFTQKDSDQTFESKLTTESILETSSSSDPKPYTSIETTTDSLEPSLVETTATVADEKIDEPETTSAAENEIEDILTTLPPGRIPGEGDCLLNEITYRNNSEVPSSNVCHTSCRCISSIIKCDPIICSPPPEYMDNCQLTYDPPGSCCPTYVCHTGETMPPQPHSQMSGTESPEPSPAIECHGDECEIRKHQETPTIDSSKTPAGDLCESAECGAQPQSPITELPIEKCDDGKCLPPTPQCADGECQATPVEEPVIVPVKDVPLCENEADCNRIKPESPSCEGEGCEHVNLDCSGSDCGTAAIKPPVESSPVCENEEDCKNIEPEAPLCNGEGCQHAVSGCSGSDCISNAAKLPAESGPVCENGEDCKEIEPDTTLCLGEECTPINVGCVGSDCSADSDKPSVKPADEQRPDGTVEPCTETSCRRKETGEVQDPGPSDCEGSECVQQMPTSEDNDNVSATELPNPDAQPVDVTTSKQEVQTDLPETNLLENVTPEQPEQGSTPISSLVNEEAVLTSEKSESSQDDKHKTESTPLPETSTELDHVPTTEPIYPVGEDDTFTKAQEIVPTEQTRIGEPDVPGETVTKAPENVSSSSVTEYQETTTKTIQEKPVQTEILQVTEPQYISTAEPQESSTKTTQLEETGTELPEQHITDINAPELLITTSQEGLLEKETKPSISQELDKDVTLSMENVPSQAPATETSEVPSIQGSTDSEHDATESPSISPIATESEAHESEVTESDGTFDTTAKTPKESDIPETEATTEFAKDDSQTTTEEKVIYQSAQTQSPSYIQKEDKTSAVDTATKKITGDVDRITEAPEMYNTKLPEDFTEALKPVTVAHDSVATDSPVLEEETKPSTTASPVHEVMEETLTKVPEIPEDVSTEKETGLPFVTQKNDEEIASTQASIPERNVAQTESFEVPAPGEQVPKTPEYLSTVKEDQQTEVPVIKITDSDTIMTEKPDDSLTIQTHPEDEDKTKPTQKPTETDESVTEEQEISTEEPSFVSLEESPVTEKIPSEPFLPVLTEATIDSMFVQPGATTESVEAVTETQTLSSVVKEEETKEPDFIGVDEKTEAPVDVHEANIPEIMPEGPSTVISEYSTQYPEVHTGITEDKEPHKDEEPQKESTEIPSEFITKAQAATEIPVILSTEQPKYSDIPTETGSVKIPEDSTPGLEEQSQTTVETVTLGTRIKDEPTVDIESQTEGPEKIFTVPVLQETTVTSILPAQEDYERTTQSQVTETGSAMETSMPESHVKEPQPQGTESPKITATEPQVLGTDFPHVKPTPEEPVAVTQPETLPEIIQNIPTEANLEETTQEEFKKKPTSAEMSTETSQDISTDEESSEKPKPDVTLKEQDEITELMQDLSTKRTHISEEPMTTVTSVQEISQETPTETAKDTVITESMHEQPTEKPVDGQEMVTITQNEATNVPQETQKEPHDTFTKTPQDTSSPQESDSGEPEKHTVSVLQVTTPVAQEVVTDTPQKEVSVISDEIPTEAETTEAQEQDKDQESPTQLATEEPYVPKQESSTQLPESPIVVPVKDGTEQPFVQEQTTPDLVELEEHSHKPLEGTSTISPTYDLITESHDEEQKPETSTEKDSNEEDITKLSTPSDEILEVTVIDDVSDVSSLPSTENDEQSVPMGTSARPDQRFGEDTSDEGTQTTQATGERGPSPDVETPVEAGIVPTTESNTEPETTASGEYIPMTSSESSVSTIPEEIPQDKPEDGLTEEPAEDEKATEQPLDKPAEIPTSMPLDEPKEKPEEIPTQETTEKSEETPVKESTEKIDEHVEGTSSESPLEIPVEKSSETPEVEPTEEPVVEPIEEHTEEIQEMSSESSLETALTADKPQDEAVEKPVQEPVEVVQLEPLDKPTEEPIQKPEETLEEKPVEESLETPTEKPMEKPIKGTSEKPEEVTVQELGEKTEDGLIEVPISTDQTKPEEDSEEKPVDVPSEKPDEKQDEKPLERPVESPEDKPLEGPVESPEDKPLEGPVESPEDKPLEGPFESPEDKPLEGPVESPEDKPLEGPVESPEDKPLEGPVESPENKPLEGPAKSPEDKPLEGPVESPEDKPLEGPVESPEDKPLEGPVESPEDKPLEGPVVSPEDKPLEGPVESPEDKPLEEPVESPEDKPLEGFVESPEDKPQEGPVESPIDKPLKEPIVPPEEVSFEQTTEKLAEEPAEKPAGEPSDVLAVKPEEKPIQESEEKPEKEPTKEPSGLPDEEPLKETDLKPDDRPEEKPTDEKRTDKPEVATEGKPTPEEKPDEKPFETPDETVASTAAPETPKPGFNEVQPTDEVPDDFPPSGGTSGYGNEPDYVEEDQAFGPGTCRYGGKVYVSAQQIPRDDPCDFCFCFRSDIICLQQSCPPPIHGCHEEPIQGFCCPRYECPVAMATTLNVTTTTTTTTTTLPPHFLPHAYKGAAQRRGCQIKGHTYKVGEVVRASSGPCLHCTCGGDGQMKCDPKACTPEPMLRQMIAAAVSAKRRR